MIATEPPGRVASQRELVRRVGISHTTLQEAQRAGRIAPEDDGSWDIDKVRAGLADSSDGTLKLGPDHSMATRQGKLLPPRAVGQRRTGGKCADGEDYT